MFFTEKNFRHVLIIGDKKGVASTKNLIEQNDEWGIKVAEVWEKTTQEQLSQYLQNKVIDDVIFIIGQSRLNEIQNNIAICEQMGVSVHLMTDLFINRSGRARIEDFYGTSMVTLDAVKRKAWEQVVKRAMDFLVALIASLIFLPLMGLIAIIIKLTSPGPVLFAQTRVGLNGRRIKLIKFRSMVVGAEKMQESLKDKNEMSGPVFKIKNDPRLTPIGKMLRKSSLDELPQLWNVLKGDISLVGPRPLPDYEVKKLHLWQRRRLSVMPGITCLWQISGRNEIDFDAWMKLDMKYIDTWSLWLDLKILVLTIPAVIMQKGAR
jgi:exopolysaccharide biosynthesis polyprenyl glycosylphosphotransferase